MVTIIDYAINNLRSVEKAFVSMSIPVEVTDDPERIRKAQKLVLPGVGAFADAMSNLQAKNLIAAIRESERWEKQQHDQPKEQHFGTMPVRCGCGKI